MPLASPPDDGPGAVAWRQFRARARFGSLDGLRCLSILGVIWHHGPGGTMTGLGGTGSLGVPLFFAISGFLITTLLLREHDRDGTVSLTKFYARRSLRIFPLYFLVLGLYVALVLLIAPGQAASQEFLRNVPYFLTYTSNWFVGTAGTFAFAWSLAAEEQFYSTWPWFVKWLTPPRAIWWVAALLVVTIGWRIGGAGRIDAALWLRVLIGSIQMAICWGCLLAFMLNSRRGFEWLWPVLGHRFSALAFLVLTGFALGSGSSIILVHFLFAALVGACVIREDTWMAPVLQVRFVAHIGVVSYGMYLWHGLVYDVLDQIGARVAAGWNGHGFAAFILATMLTTAVATLSFWYFESPFLRLKSRFSAKA